MHFSPHSIPSRRRHRVSHGAARPLSKPDKLSFGQIPILRFRRVPLVWCLGCPLGAGDAALKTHAAYSIMHGCSKIIGR